MIDLIHALAKREGIRLHGLNHLWLVEGRDCEKIVEACERSSILILGIDAFKVNAGRAVAHTDITADFSDLLDDPFDQACKEAAKAARGFLATVEGRDDLWFEFTLEQLH